MKDVKSKNPNNLQPIYFSDYFGIEKSKLKELGTFDPIINFDTALFVEPLLLKKSSSEIIKNATSVYNKYFVNILMLLRAFKVEGDVAWQGAKKLINFPEYKYTCIGYAGTSSSGSGSGKEFNEKILYRAKEIIEISRDEPEILPFLALLEEGIGGDRISDMTQKIIDKEICEYTINVMKQIDFKGELRQYETAKYDKYQLPYNSYSKCVLKLLPEDILSNLPIANTFDEWTLQAMEHNSILRDRINQELGEEWMKATKAYKKETLIEKIKTDKEFFIQIINALKESTFEHYNLDKDSEGLYRWLEDSQKFIKLDSLQEAKQCEDTLEAISFHIELIIRQFQELVEKQDLWRIFWVKINNKDIHVKEFYSQMLFYVVCSSWLKSQNSNVQLFREYNKEAKQMDLRFTISSRFNVFVQIKHANNNQLENGYKKQLEIHNDSKNSQCLFAIINFKEEESRQLKDVRLIQKKCCKVSEIQCVQALHYSNSGTKQEWNEDLPIDELNLTFQDLDIKIEDIDVLDFDIPMIEFEDMPKLIDNSQYIKGAKKKNRYTDLIKSQIIKPMFLFIKKDWDTKSKAYHVSDISKKIINQLGDLTQEKLMQTYKFDDKSLLEKAIQYSNNKAGGEIDNWCYKVNKGQI